jgi:hypothetical protein
MLLKTIIIYQIQKYLKKKKKNYLFIIILFGSKLNKKTLKKLINFINKSIENSFKKLSK